MEANNMKALREALLSIRKALLVDSGMGPHTAFHNEVDRLTAEALSAPPRQCDIGTAEEQEERFTKVCTANSRDGVRGLCSATCPFSRDYQSECALAWGQTPYAEEQKGGTDGGE